MLHQTIRSWYTDCWWVGCYIWYSKEGPWRAGAPPSPLLDVTVHPSTASVPITVLLYDDLLLCGFIVVIKRLKVTKRGLTVQKCLQSSELTFRTRSITQDTFSIRISMSTGATVTDTSASISHQVICNRRQPHPQQQLSDTSCILIIHYPAITIHIALL